MYLVNSKNKDKSCTYFILWNICVSKKLAFIESFIKTGYYITSMNLATCFCSLINWVCLRHCLSINLIFSISQPLSIHAQLHILLQDSMYVLFIYQNKGGRGEVMMELNSLKPHTSPCNCQPAVNRNV